MYITCWYHLQRKADSADHDNTFPNCHTVIQKNIRKRLRFKDEVLSFKRTNRPRIKVHRPAIKGGRIKRVEKHLDSDTNMLTYGDGLADIDLNKLLEFHKSHDKIVTITGVHRPSRFGELVEEGDQVRSFTEKPRLTKDLISGGFMVFDKEMLDYLLELQISI